MLHPPPTASPAAPRRRSAPSRSRRSRPSAHPRSPARSACESCPPRSALPASAAAPAAFCSATATSPSLHAAPHPHLPVHRRNAILDHVDRAPHHRRLRKPAQIRRRRLGQVPARKLHRAQNRRQRQRLAFRLRIGRAAAMLRCSVRLRSPAARSPATVRLPSRAPSFSRCPKTKRHNPGKGHASASTRLQRSAHQLSRKSHSSSV